MMVKFKGEPLYAFITLVLLLVTMVIPGGRVLVLPVLFALCLVLLYWLAKPKDEE